MSTPDEIREHNEQVLRNIDRVDRVHKFWKSLGATDEQAATTAAAHADKFTWNGATLEFQGKAVADPANGVREFFDKNNLSFLLPPKENADKPEIDPALLASARAGNQTSRSRIYRLLGDLAATDALIAKKPDTAADTTTKEKPARAASDPKNPFVGFRDASGKVDPAKSAIVAARIKSDGIAAVTKLAKEAGVTLGGYPLRKAG